MSRPRSQERFFATWCNDGGAVASEPDEDINGWDYLVEFADNPHNGPAEQSPARRQAFVQIKSTRLARLSTTVKLTNMLRSAGSPDAWFIFLLTKDRRVYGRHVGTELISDTLKAVRIAETEETSLHRRKLTIGFQATDEIPRSSNVAEWMLSHMHPTVSEYALRKTEDFQKVGFSDTQATLKFTLDLSPGEDLSMPMLGLGGPLQFRDAELRHVRFGIADKRPTFINRGLVTITPQAARECEVVIRGRNPLTNRVALKGKVYTYRPCATWPGEAYARFVAPPIELVRTPDGKIDFKSTLNEDKTYALATYDAYCDIEDLFREGGVEIEIRSKGRVVAKLPIDNSSAPSFKIVLMFRAINLVLRKAARDEIEYSIQQIREELFDISIAAQLLTNGSMKLEIPRLPNVPRTPPASLLYTLEFKLGAWHCRAIALRRVRKVAELDNHTVVYADEPQLLSSIIDNEDHTDDLINELYDEIAEHLRDEDRLLELGNLSALFREGTND